MATAASQLQTLLTVGQLFGATNPKGQKTTQTTSNNVSQQGIEYLMQQALSGPGGLASIGAQARAAGLYDSTTEQLLKNDAAARAAGEAESRRSSQTTTQQTTATGGTLNPMALALPALGLLRSAGGLGGITSGISNLFNPITAAPGVSLAGQGLAAGSLAGAAAGSTAANAGTTLSSLLGGGEAAGGLLSSLGGTAATAPAVTGAISAAPGFSLAGAGDAVGSLGGASAALSSVPGIGGVLSGLLGGTAPGDQSLESFLGTALTGAAAGGPVGMVAAPAFAVLGGMANDLGLSIICTALMKKGLLDARLYATGQSHFASLHRFTVIGYHSWGRKVARKIEQGHAFSTRVCLPWARSRTNLLAARGVARYVRWPLGTLTILVGQPICFAIGAALVSLEKLKGVKNGLNYRASN